MVEIQRYAVKYVISGEEQFLLAAMYSSNVSSRQCAELYVSLDAAKKAVSRVKKRFPGLVERGAEFSCVPVVVTFGY